MVVICLLTYLDWVPALSSLPSLQCFLGSPPKEAIYIQAFVSESASRGTQLLPVFGCHLCVWKALWATLASPVRSVVWTEVGVLVLLSPACAAFPFCVGEGRLLLGLSFSLSQWGWEYWFWRVFNRIRWSNFRKVLGTYLTFNLLWSWHSFHFIQICCLVEFCLN